MRGPDSNYFNGLNSNNFDSQYVFEQTFKRYLCHIKKHGNLSLIHVHIKSIDSNFEKQHNFLLNCSDSFNMICVTKKWNADEDLKNNSNFDLPKLDFIHQEIKTGKKAVEF